ncbi:MAG: hypothetical protein NC117_07170 [Pseudoflavonifractor sp.]|nr:hypothetical protein [Pseudoflavonifractor sp.]
MNMNKIDEALRTCYELEGLLLLAADRREELPERVQALIADKVKALGTMVNECHEDDTEDLERVGLVVEERVADDMEAGDETVTVAADAVVDHADADAYTEINTDSDFEADSDADVSTDIVEMGTEDIESEDEDSDIEENVGEEVGHRASMLRRSFTINDKFRFRRELFGNSETEFADTLNLVSAMGSLSEAEDYFYGDLEWDADNEEVKDFMDVISRYFNSPIGGAGL